HARTVADRLRGKERFKNPVQHLGLNSASRIRNADANIRSRTGIRVMSGLVLVDVYRGGDDRQLPALRHGISRVDDDVDEHLFHAPTIGTNRRESLPQRALKSNILTD